MMIVKDDRCEWVYESIPGGFQYVRKHRHDDSCDDYLRDVLFCLTDKMCLSVYSIGLCIAGIVVLMIIVLLLWHEAKSRLPLADVKEQHTPDDDIADEETLAVATEDQDAADDDPRALRCRYCLVRRIAIVFQPCGHAVCCRACAVSQTRCMYCCSDVASQIAMVLG